MRIYTVVTVEDYIPHVQLTTTDEERTIAWAKEYSAGWNHELTGSAGEVYFNQKEDGSMEYAVTVQATEVEQQIPLDEETREKITNLAHVIFNNDGIEEFVPRDGGLCRTSHPQRCHATDMRHLKAATHAAFGAMLLGIPLEEAVDTVLINRTDILEG